MRYILDTNAVAALMKGHERTVARLLSADRGNVTVPQTVISEIAYGIERLPRSKRREIVAGRFDLIRTEISRVPWTDAVSERYGFIKATLERRGERIEDFDAAIAAHALATDAVLATANLHHMARIPGLTVEDWATS